MAKELKQRKIKKDNKKYIKLSIIIILIIVILSLFAAVIVKTIANSKKKINDSDNIVQSNQTNVNETKTKIKNNTIDILDEQLNQLTNNAGNTTNITNTNINNANTTNEIREIHNNNKEITKKYDLTDAVIHGIQREMTIEQVKALLGEPENFQNEQEVTTGYTVQKYFYDEGKTEIDFVALYEPNKFIVHRIKTSSTSTILTRELKIGSTAEDVLARFPDESILYKSQDIIIVGFPGEDPIYATSIKPKLYFTINNNVVTELSLNIGSES